MCSPNYLNSAGQPSFRRTTINENFSPQIINPVLPDSADAVSTSPVASESSELESPLEEINSQSNTAEDSISDQLVNLGFGSWRCSVCDQVFRRKQRALTHFAHNHGSTRMTCGGMCGKPH
ncbi:1789_t:CDS:1, partial [Acaulospora colombiana]